MKHMTCRAYVALLALVLAPLLADDAVWDSNFSRGLRGWQLGYNCTLRREGATMFVRLVGPPRDGVAECRSPLLELDGKEQEYELTCTYRTDIEDSHLHGGAWFILYKKDADDKMVGDWTGVVLKPSAEWGVATGRIVIPAGTKTFQAGIRVQGREGRVLDVKSVTLRRVR